MITTISQNIKSRRRTARAIDNAMAAAAIVHPATAVPQAIQIYETHNSAGVAPLTWLSFMAASRAGPRRAGAQRLVGRPPDHGVTGRPFAPHRQTADQTVVRLDNPTRRH